MALPSSGPISGSQIGTELGISTGPYSLRNMSASASFSSPDAMSEFYGYSSAYNVTIYSRAGATPNSSYDLYYSPDNTNWTLVVDGASNTICGDHLTATISTGVIYLKATVSSAFETTIYIRGANISTCPANQAVVCTYQVSVTGNEDVAITVYVDGSGNFQTC
jgi:hypothetical protein